MPTVAFHFRKVRKVNVTLSIWDLAGVSLSPVHKLISLLVSLIGSRITPGQPRYRSIWERYCNGVDSVV